MARTLLAEVELRSSDPATRDLTDIEWRVLLRLFAAPNDKQAGAITELSNNRFPSLPTVMRHVRVLACNGWIEWSDAPSEVASLQAQSKSDFTGQHTMETFASTAQLSPTGRERLARYFERLATAWSAL